MPSPLTNTLLDTLGIFKAVMYRTFIERIWSTPQPMFNILQVKPNTEPLFEEFLAKSLHVSLKFNTPLSLGPFKTENRTYIYITHYASTKAYLQVMNGLLFGGEVAMRAKATLKTSWTYCLPTQTAALQNTQQIIMVGIEGNPDSFLDRLEKTTIQPLALIQKKKDVRGTSLSTYAFFKTEPTTEDYLLDCINNGDTIKIYHAKKLT